MNLTMMVAWVVAIVSAAGMASAATIRTAPLTPGSEQMLVCTVVNLSDRPLSITAHIIDRRGDDATCFIRTDWDPTETVLRTVHVEATSPDARYCRVTVRGGRRASVAVTLQACDFEMRACTGPAVPGGQGHRRF